MGTDRKVTALPTWDELMAAVTAADLDDDPRRILIDWDEFWSVDHNHADWLLEPLIASGRSHAMFAPGGTGKSLLALWMAVRAATGGCVFTPVPVQPIDVLYLDYEMTTADLAERLEAMEYGPETDLSHLHYALLPAIAPLDEPEGGKAVVELATEVDAKLVVIDTFSRAVHGDENDADTVRAWYRWTGLHLKHDGRAFLRVDHAGKDLDKGQRGSSAKNDDVDVVWQMARADGGNAFTITARKRRMGWVPDQVKLLRSDDPLRYTLTEGNMYPTGTAEMVAALDALGVPVEVSVRAARAALKAADVGAKQAVLVAAIKYRKEQGLRFEPVDNTAEPVDKVLPDFPGNTSADPNRVTPGVTNTKPLVVTGGYHPVTPSESRGVTAPLYRAVTPDRPPDPTLRPDEELW
jgi:hypothetical protein